MTTKEAPLVSCQNIISSSQRQVTNQASTQVFNEELLAEIKKSGLTSAIIEKLPDSVKVYLYKTQITIHGTITEEQIKVLEASSNYKNSPNENGTFGIRYSCIDISTKRKLNDTLRSVGQVFEIPVPSLHQDSRYTIFKTSFKEEEHRDEMGEKIDTSLFVGKKEYSLNGHKNSRGNPYCLDIYVGLIKEHMIWPIVANWTGITYEKYTEELEARTKAWNTEQERLSQEREQLRLQAEQKTQENYQAALQAIAHLPIWKGEVENEEIILIRGIKSSGDNPEFQFVRVLKGSCSWRYECYAHNSDKESFPTIYFYHFSNQAHRDRFLSESQWHVWQKKVAEPIPKKEVQVQDIELWRYKKGLAVFTNNPLHIERLLKFDPIRSNALTHPSTGKKTEGFIFPPFQQFKIEQAFGIKMQNIAPEIRT